MLLGWFNKLPLQENSLQFSHILKPFPVEKPFIYMEEEKKQE
jgi:hypothetical protein